MIQDIAPHRFKNEFYIKTPSPDHSAFYIQNHKVLLVRENEDSCRLPKFLDLEKVAPDIAHHSDYLFSIDSQEYYLIDETSVSIPETDSVSFYDFGIFRVIRPMETAFAGITGIQLHRFYRSRAYCGCCGAKMEKSTTERAMVCPSCHIIEYPKISPAVIVAVMDKDRLLLTKYADREYTRYALIAGFTEIGETLEQTVEREVMEEVGLRVKNITYYKNQPWSFTDSLLVGFFAELEGSPEIHMDRGELSVAEWVQREDIPQDFTDLSLTHEMILLFRNNYPHMSAHESP